MSAINHRPPAAWRPRASIVPGTHVALLVDSEVPGADLYAGVNVLDPGGVIPLHWHPTGELQFILAGEGVAFDATGVEAPVSAHSSVFSRPGQEGAHGFRNTGHLPLTILFVYAAPGGVSPPFHRAAKAGS